VLPSSNVPATPHFAPAAYGLAAVLAWGTSDFLGGYATRRANAFLFTTVVNLGGLFLVGTLALATHAPFPSARSVAWVVAGGISGGASLAIFYRALSSGRMGVTAPVAAVLSAAIPTLFSIFTEGLPGRMPIPRFRLRSRGLWLITRTEDGGTPEGVGLAVLSGIGFASFYLCVRQASDASVFWMASLTRIWRANRHRCDCPDTRQIPRDHALPECAGACSPAALTRSVPYFSFTPARADASTKRSSFRHSIPP
jgi:uncharacterized membrane protein